MTERKKCRLFSNFAKSRVPIIFYHFLNSFTSSLCTLVSTSVKWGQTTTTIFHGIKGHTWQHRAQFKYKIEVKGISQSVIRVWITEALNPTLVRAKNLMTDRGSSASWFAWGFPSLSAPSVSDRQGRLVTLHQAQVVQVAQTMQCCRGEQRKQVQVALEVEGEQTCTKPRKQTPSARGLSSDTMESKHRLWRPNACVDLNPSFVSASACSRCKIKIKTATP